MIVNVLVVLLTRLAVLMFFVVISVILLLGWLTDNLDSFDKIILASLLIMMLIVQMKTKGWERSYWE